MNIFIELPTWLGDAVMATPAIEELIKQYPNAKLTFFGSYLSTEAFKYHPKTLEIKIDESKKSAWRFLWLYKTVKRLRNFDIAISFRSSLSSKWLLFNIRATQKMLYPKNGYQGHQVEKYTHFLHVSPSHLKLYQTPFHFEKPTLGINPGATYGSAKRWYPEEFAKVAMHFAGRYDIVIFGGPNEVDIAHEVETFISAPNVTNLAGQTTVEELIEKIAGLSLFITNDSGPMHVAAAYQIPTVALFGPTKYTETSPWKNPNAYILSHNLSCAPCMKRECPIKTHACMRGIKAEEVIDLLERHLSLDK